MDESCCDRMGGGDQVCVLDRDWDGWAEETEGIATRKLLSFLYALILSHRRLGCCTKGSAMVDNIRSSRR